MAYKIHGCTMTIHESWKTNYTVPCFNLYQFTWTSFVLKHIPVLKHEPTPNTINPLRFDRYKNFNIRSTFSSYILPEKDERINISNMEILCRPEVLSVKSIVFHSLKFTKIKKPLAQWSSQTRQGFRDGNLLCLLYIGESHKTNKLPSMYPMASQRRSLDRRAFFTSLPSTALDSTFKISGLPRCSKVLSVRFIRKNITMQMMALVLISEVLQTWFKKNN